MSLLKKLKGTGVAVVTPFKKDLSIDFVAIKNLVDFLVEFLAVVRDLDDFPDSVRRRTNRRGNCFSRHFVSPFTRRQILFRAMDERSFCSDY